MDRPLDGDVLVFDLGEETRHVTGAAPLEGGRRSARTLLKSGPLRVTLIVLGPGAEMLEHRAEGPITVQPLDGRIRFTVLDTEHDLGPGQLLSVGAGVRHAVFSEHGASFLLTLAQP